MKHLLLIACLFVLPGCITANITRNDYKPELSTPAPAKEVFEGPEALTPREQALGQYAGKLKTTIKTYNDWAHKQNIKNGYITKDSPQGEDNVPSGN